MSEQPGQEVERISVAPLIRQYGDEFGHDDELCSGCGHRLRQLCDCPCHLPWDDTHWVKVAGRGPG